jgi:hypothetical protein
MRNMIPSPRARATRGSAVSARWGQLRRQDAPDAADRAGAAARSGARALTFSAAVITALLAVWWVYLSTVEPFTG